MTAAATGRPRGGGLGLGKYVAIGRIQLANSFAYPADLIARSLAIVLFMFVFIQLWRATYATTGEEFIQGLALADTLWYLMMAEAVILSQPRLAGTIADAVRDGSIAYLLGKPYNFLLYHLSVALGDGVLRFAVNVAAGGALVWFVAGPPPGPAGWPLVLVAVVLGWALNFAIAALIGLAAFVTEDTAAFEWIYSKMVLLLGGVLLPLDFFPETLRHIALAMPFAYTVYAPARLFVDPDIGAFVRLGGAQLAWLGIMGALLAFVYRRVVGRLAINGG